METRTDWDIVRADDAEELAAAEAFMGPAEMQDHEGREAWRGGDGEMEDCAFASSYRSSWQTEHETCRWTWASYWFIEVEPEGTFCARCLREILAAGSLPEGFEREPLDDED